MAEDWNDPNWLKHQRDALVQMLQSGRLTGRPLQLRRARDELWLIERRLDDLGNGEEFR